MSSQKRRGCGQRGGQSGRLQGEAVWGTLVGTLGQGRWEQKDPQEKKPIPGHSSAGGDREKELFCSLNDFLPSFFCLGWGSGLRSAVAPHAWQ